MRLCWERDEADEVDDELEAVDEAEESDDLTSAPCALKLLTPYVITSSPFS